ncbi:MAG: hypothetical protein ACRDQ7_11435 [Haloechinothrix sp.]
MIASTVPALSARARAVAAASVLAQIRPNRGEEINQLGIRLAHRFARDLHPGALARRTAAVVLSLATGPHRVRERDWQAKTDQRLVLAERWLEQAPLPTVGIG